MPFADSLIHIGCQARHGNKTTIVRLGLAPEPIEHSSGKHSVAALMIVIGVASRTSSGQDNLAFGLCNSFSQIVGHRRLWILSAVSRARSQSFAAGVEKYQAPRGTGLGDDLENIVGRDPGLPNIGQERCCRSEVLNTMIAEAMGREADDQKAVLTDCSCLLVE